MRKVVVYEFLSLDGVAESPNEFILDFDEAMEENLASVIGSQDTVLLGRTMYDEWSEYWPPSDIEPFASFINAVSKHVVTTSPLQRSWINATVAQGDLEEFVTSLKAEPGGDIGVHGSITLSQSLLARDLVDELRLVIAPAVVVNGRKLFEGVTPRRFEVTRNATSPTGYLLVTMTAGIPTEIMYTPIARALQRYTTLSGPYLDNCRSAPGSRMSCLRISRRQRNRSAGVSSPIASCARSTLNSAAS
jgi:dihydrofolate reductase